ncbi:MAG TPA: hypothetical protein VFH61_16315, partial [Thermoleophilia bacterium]|nr:hypothetical protein [Thermoleophilia bacterium]
MKRTHMPAALGVVAALGVAIVLTGCGSDRKALDDLRSDQRRAMGQLNQVSASLNEIRQDLRRLDRDAGTLNTSFEILSSRVDMLEIGSGGPVGSNGTVRDTTPAHTALTPDEVPITPIQAGSLGELAEEVAKLKAEVASLRGQFVSAREEEELRDPQKTWQAFSDPEKMAWRIDRFAKVWNAKIEDEGTRTEFVADVAAVKQQIDELSAMTHDEALSHYRRKLSERATAETNER